MEKADIDKAIWAIRKARFQVLQDKRMTFFGVVMMNLKPVPADWVETAAVDGRHMFFNPDFINKLTPGQVIGVIAHETGHVTGFHFDRMNGRETEKWNIATDIKINSGLRDMKIELPQGAVYGDHQHTRMTCEEVYNIIPPPKKITVKFKVGDAGGCGTMIEPRDEKGNKLTPAEARAVQHAARAVVEEASRMAKAQGSMPQFVERLINEANNEPLPWQEILKRFVDKHVKRDWTWSRPARRMMGQGVYLPSQRVEGVGEVVIGIDTSGSISQQILSAFNKEIVTMMNDASPSRVHLVYCDARVHRVDTFERGEDIVMKAVGGGGTDFRPVFNWVNDNGMDPLCLIYFTDLYGTFPQDPGYPVIWGATSDMDVPFGEKFRLDVNG